MEQLPINYFLDEVDSNKDQGYWEMYSYFFKNCGDAKGSNIKHHNVEGGYLTHVQEILNLAKDDYVWLKEKYGVHLNFPVEDSYKTLLLHDIEKPIKYTKNQTEEILLLKDKDTAAIRRYLVEKFKIHISGEVKHALKYIHGIGQDYSPTENVMSPLAIHCHTVDTKSAGIIGRNYKV